MDTLRPLKLLFVCKALPRDFAGGIQTHIWALTGQLLAAGHHVSILTAGRLATKASREWLEGRELINLPYLPGRHVPLLPITLEEYFFNLAVRGWLRRHAADYDLVHLQGRSGALVDARTAARVPVVITYHGLISYERPEDRSFDERQHKKMSLRLERAPLDKVRAAICVSEAMRDMLVALHQAAATPLHIIPNGIEDLMLPDVQARPDELVFLARVEASKGIFTLLEALPLVPERVRLNIIGTGTADAAVRRRIGELGLGKRVRMSGVLRGEALWREVQAAFALVLPSEIETQGIVLMEGNVCGRPVICGDIPGTAAVVKHQFNGLRVPIRQPEALAKAINTLYAQPQEAEAMGLRGRQFVLEQFHWRSIAEATLALYHQILSRHAAPTRLQ